MMSPPHSYLRCMSGALLPECLPSPDQAIPDGRGEGLRAAFRPGQCPQEETRSPIVLRLPGAISATESV